MQYTSSAYHWLARRARSSLLLFVLLAPVLANAGVTHTVDPTTFDYGDQLVGTSSSSQTFTFTNESGVSEADVTVALSGTNSGDFSIDSEDCSTSSPIAAGGTCTAEISFAPTAAGARAASVDFDAEFGFDPSATLDGNGIQPAVGLDRTSPLDLGSWNVAATSAAETVILTNTGTADLTLGTLGISGTDAADYTLGGNTCDSAVLTPASTCTFQITLTPSAGGTRTAQVDIPSDAPTSPDVLGLTGIGIVVGPAVDLTPSSINFGAFDVGVPSGATQVTLENVGNQTLNVGALGLSGANNGDFAIGNDNCSSQPIAAAGTCTFDVTFTPGASGARTGQVDIPSDAPTTPDAVPLSGSGNGTAAVDVNPTSINFGGQPLGVTSSTRTVTYSNTGTGDVNVGTIVIAGGAKGGDFALVADNCSGQTVAESSNCTFGVTFTPSSTGSSSASVSIPSDAPGAPHPVALTGSGIGGGDVFIDPGFSGSFGDPAFNGQGVNIEVIAPQTGGAKGSIPGLAVVYWYSFGADGFPFFTFGVGNVTGDKIIINMLWDPNGPRFGPGWMASNFQPNLFTQVTITALGCDTLLFEVDDLPQGLTGHAQVMDRITNVVGAPCFGARKNMVQRRDENPALLKGGVNTVATRSGSFYDPEFNGQGINTEVLDFATKGFDVTGTVLVYWYTFDPSGQPVFAFGVGNYNNDVMTVRMLMDYDGGGPFFGPGWDPGDFNPGNFADVQIIWDGCDDAVMTFQMLGDFQGGWSVFTMRLERITALAGSICS